jgi:hypothetical protein
MSRSYSLGPRGRLGGHANRQRGGLPFPVHRGPPLRKNILVEIVG